MTGRRHPTMTITCTKAGTYTLHLERPGRGPERWRAGIKTEAEARQRAGIVAANCGYRVDPVVRYL